LVLIDCLPVEANSQALCPGLHRDTWIGSPSGAGQPQWMLCFICQSLSKGIQDALRKRCILFLLLDFAAIE